MRGTKSILLGIFATFILASGLISASAANTTNHGATVRATARGHGAAISALAHTHPGGAAVSAKAKLHGAAVRAVAKLKP